MPDPKPTGVSFTEDSFSTHTEGEEHFELKLSNGSVRRLRKLVVYADMTSEESRKLTIEDYRRLVLEKRWLGPLILKNNEGKRFEAFLYWTFEQSPTNKEKGGQFLDGGMSKYIYFARVPGADPNTKEAVFDTRFSWVFPSIGMEKNRISKTLFGKTIGLLEASEIVKQNGPGLTAHGLIGPKEKPFSAIIKWDFVKEKVSLTYLDAPKATESEGPAV